MAEQRSFGMILDVGTPQMRTVRKLRGWNVEQAAAKRRFRRCDSHGYRSGAARLAGAEEEERGKAVARFVAKMYEDDADLDPPEGIRAILGGYP